MKTGTVAEPAAVDQLSVGQAITRILKAEGTEYLFCFPYNALIDAAAEIGIRPIMTRTERTLVNMADGYARVGDGRRIGVCAVQSGPGIENAFAGVAQAYADHVPLLLLPGQSDQRRLGSHPTFDATRHYSGVTKWAERVNLPERAPQLLRRAYTHLRNGRRGPVVLEVPQDVVDAPLPGPLDYRPVRPSRAGPDPADAREAATLLLRAERPVLHVGQGVLYAGATAELRELAELVGTPVMTTIAGKSAFPEDHPLSLGTGSYTGPRAVAHFLKKADLIFGVGCSFSRAPLACPLPTGIPFVQLTLDDADVDTEYPVACAVLGDARLSLAAVIAEVRRQLGEGGRRDGAAAAREIDAVREEWLAEWMPRLTSDEAPISPYRVAWEISRTLDPARSIVTHDSGHPRDQIIPFYRATTPRGYLGWGNSTQLGYSLGLSLGARLAAPDKTVLSLMGDAAFGMCGMDVETAARERIGVVLVVMNNSALGGYEKHMPIATERYRTKFLTGDYTRVAEGLGAYAECVRQPGQLADAIGRCRAVAAGGRPAVLEVITREDATMSRYW